ncbi:MAG TPA: response regulator [Gemmatimonadaceae bacterium]|nr:response regulator [Gemmatimonadaceae bacterium]
MTRASRRATPSELTGEAEHLLLADDDGDRREALAGVLRRRWQVETVADGAEALAAVRRNRPDLVVADIALPVFDGPALLRALRSEPSTASLPLILMTDRVADDQETAGPEAEADDYLVRPFLAQQLMARVSTQLELFQLRQSAQSERARLFALFTQAPVIIGAFEGPEHTIVLANAEWEYATGRRIPLGLPLVDALPELEGQPIIEVHDRVVRSERGETIYEFPIRFGSADASAERFFTLLFEPLRDAEGAMIGYMTIGFDVTGQVAARRKVDEQTRELAAAHRVAEDARATAESASQVKDEFLALLGHELRNPLAPIVTALQLMQLRAGADHTFDREREVIERQVAHLTHLVDDLLDVSRITRGRIELHRAPIEMGRIVAKAIEQASPLLELRGHQLTVDVPANGLCVSGDEHRLSQVVSHLVANAAKYTDHGGRIAIRGWRDGDEAVLSVRDNGSGIRPELLPRIFDLFVQGKRTSARAEGGLGLGLAIARNFVTLHGGTVIAHSDGPGLGSEFIVRLPRIEAPAGTRNGVSAPASRVPRDGERVMVVDDNVDAAELIADGLRVQGFTVRVAHDPLNALELAREFAPAICVLDIGLPVIDGYDLARRLRELLGSGVALIAVTGYGQPSDRERSRAAGFAEHLVKPVEVRVLADRIARVRWRASPRENAW